MTKITFGWNEIPCGSRGGYITYKYTLDSRPPTTTPNTAVTLTGLNPCTSYLFKVRAINDAGDGGEGSVMGSTNDLRTMCVSDLQNLEKSHRLQ